MIRSASVEPAQHEVVGLQPDRGQVVLAPPIEHPLCTPGVQDADPGRYGQIVQARDRHVPDDAGPASRTTVAAAPHCLDRVVGRLDPVVIGAGAAGPIPRPAEWDRG